MKTPDRRFFVVSPDNVTAAGFDTRDAAQLAALAFGDGAHVIDTAAQPYQPAVQKVESGVLEYVGFGMFDVRKGVDGGLMDAAKKAYPALVRAFLAKGADVTARDKNGGTALHWGVAGGDLSVVAMLIEAGADVNSADNDGDTPLIVARLKKRDAIAEMLSAHGA